MKKLINKIKNLSKIDKIQIIVTFLVAIACLVGCICLFTCKNKPKQQPVILSAVDIREEPNFLGSSTMDVNRVYFYNGSYQNNMGAVACFRVNTDFQYYTMPFNLEVAFDDMLMELDAVGSMPYPLCSYWCYSYTYASNTTNMSNSDIQTECTQFLRYLCMNYYVPSYSSSSNLLVDVSLDFTNNTKLLSTPQFTLSTYTYFFVGVAFGFNTTDNTNLSIILPYSDSISCDTFLFNYTYDEILQVNDFSNNWQEGYEEGKKQGRLEGANSEYSRASGIIPDMMSFIFSAPVNFIRSAFDIDFLGINLAGLLLGFISALLVGWIIKKLL